MADFHLREVFRFMVQAFRGFQYWMFFCFSPVMHICFLAVLPLMSPFPNTCGGITCGTGYACSIKHNQPQCIPEPQSCSAFQCPEGTLCEMVESLPTCMPYTPSCHHVQCKEGTVCDLAEGFPKCVPIPRSCADIHCKEGTTCAVTNNWPQCIPAPASCQNFRCDPGMVCKLVNGQPQCMPSKPSCHQVQCKDETICEIVHGQPKCVPAPASCGVILCNKGAMCEMVNGRPKCVPLPPSCLQVECRQGMVCDIVEGWPKCIPGPTCENLNCEAGTECKTVNGLPICAPTPPSCNNIHCKPGTLCEIVNGKPVCIPIPPSCNTVHCQEGMICESIDNVPRCVPSITSCDKIQCTVGTVCEMVNDWPMCVPIPRSCETIVCKRGTVCDIVNGWPTCVPDLPTSCASVVCREDAVCEMVNGLPTCIPMPLSCERYTCRPETICEVMNGWPTCVPRPSSCQQIECTQGTVCKIIDSWPKCVPIATTCAKMQCKEGTICEAANGQPKCVPVPRSCQDIYCRLGTICQIVEGWPRCTPIAPSCDKIHCREKSTCKMIDGWPQCVPIPPSCDKLGCKDGTTCEIIDDWPMCVPIPASCDKIQCREGTLCEMVDGWPTCHLIPISCEKVSCNVGTVCEIYNGQPRCIPISPSCDNFPCRAGTVCQISNGWPQCVSIPVPVQPSCESFNCSVGTVCEIYGGQPTCIPISPSCDRFQCSAGTVCQISNGWPQCVSIPVPVQPSCESFNCSVGTVCEIYGGQPTCIPISPFCDRFQCSAGTVCQITNGWPQCVPIPSCGNVTCNVGTICQMVSGWPQCVPTPSSCDQFSCRVGTVCETVNGWPQCIPVTSFCGITHCRSGYECQIIDGRPRCVATAQLCRRIQCREGTVCKVVSGSARCAPILPTQPVCWASGHPHYHTFDGHSYDFQGTCTYTVIKTCKPSSTLPFFHIFTKSQKRLPFSFVNQVTITVYSYNITMVKYEYGLVRINQVRSRLPVSLSEGKLSLFHRGGQLVIETQFGLKVYYDWNYYLVVKVTPAFQNQICGLCGNYNGDPNDDFLTSSGGLATTAVGFGKSWKVEDGGTACSHGCHGKCWRCAPELVARYSAETFCGLITKHRGGPFWLCRSVIDPKPYLNDCVTDLCTFEGYKQILCRALKTYADACQREGVVISAWRKQAGCPLTCPDYSQYVACGSACPATCTNPDAPKKCHLPCMETCQCKPGYVLDAGRCIPKSRCGCNFHGQLYAPNERFWGDNQCHQQCLCRAQDRKVVCHSARCSEVEGCHVVNGMRKCYPTVYGTCTALGQLHYITFDGLRFDFYGTCVYRLAELCHRSANLTQFHVLVQQERQGLKVPSAAKATEIKVYGMTVTISRSQVLLNGLLINLPYNIEYDKVSLYRQGWDIVLTTDFGLTVTFDGKNNIRLTVPGTYRGYLCGLCGNYNGWADDDMLQQNGMPATNPGEFGRSWKVRDIPGCVEKEKKACHDLVTVERVQSTSKECGILLDKHGPFKMCHRMVPPQSYFKDCVFDYCSNRGNKNVICHILSSYVAACQTAGIHIYEWRSTNLCMPDCPANSHYKVCASDCPMTCRSLFNPVLCTAKCREGCECNEGFVLSGDQCVPISQCGCVHQGFYYKAGESFYLNGFCKERCVCQVGGIMECHRSSCGPHEECRLIDGVQTCHGVASRRSGTCHVSGDPHYLTFDGSKFDIQSNCTYILARSCTLKSSVPSFSVHVENERRSRGKVSVTKVVSVIAFQNTISILREKRGFILVNGATTYLPFRLENDGMWVYYHGDNIVLRTDFGLFISFDQLYHLIVKVPDTYQGQMCGLCGNYNGRPHDDFFLPTGHPAMSIRSFVTAWKVDGPTAACAEDCAASVCGACQQSRKASYVQNSQCGILQAPYGPFSACYSTINPTDFYNNCVHDLCKARGNPVILCRAIRSYAIACQAAGVKIQPWRTATFCRK
ncbi:IgGFc-binding protein [Varanus komodoensis]|nr:IgGFc-binding protein [Varanus komodoensis]